MTAIGRLLAWLVTASTVVGAVSVVLMMVQMVLDVLLKNLFNVRVPTTTIIVPHYYMIIVSYLPLALAEKFDRHITVDLVFRNLSRRLRQWVLCVVWLFSAIVSGAIAHRLWFEAMKKFQAGSVIIEQNTPIVVWPGYFVLPVGFGLLALVLLYRFVCGVSGVAGGLGEVKVDEDAPPADAAEGHLRGHSNG